MESFDEFEIDEKPHLLIKLDNHINNGSWSKCDWKLQYFLGQL